MADHIYADIFTESAIQESGANAYKIIEQLEKNANTLKKQSRFTKGTIFLNLIMIVVFPLSIFTTIENSVSNGVNLDWAICIGSLGIAAFFILQLLILIMFQVSLFKYIVSGDSFKWIATFPISKKDLEKSIFLTIFKAINVPIYGTLLVLPITVFILTQNPLLTLVSIGFSLVNSLYAITILVNLSKKVNTIFKTTNQTKSKGSLMKLAVMLLYIVVIMVTILGMQFLPKLLNEWLYSEPSVVLLDAFRILIILPTPISPAYLLMVLNFKFQSGNIWIGFLGLILWVTVSIRLFSKMFKKLPEIIKDPESNKDEDRSSVKIEKADIVYESASPIKAFMKKDLSMFGKDMQMFIYFLIPGLFGLLGVFFIQPEDRFSITLFTFMALSIIFLMVALTHLDADGTTFLASVPYRPRDQFLARIWFFPIVLVPAYLIPVLFLFNHPYYVDLIISTLVWVWWGPLWGILGFELKILMFGKMKNKFVLEEVNKNNMILKRVVFSVTMIMLSPLFMFVSIMAIETGGMYNYIVYNLIGFGVIGLIDYGLFKYLFSERKKIYHP